MKVVPDQVHSFPGKSDELRATAPSERAVRSISRRTFVVGEYPDGSPISSPMLRLEGPRPGPVLWVQACVHGTEIVGPLAIHRFLKSVEIESMLGAVVCLILANPLAYRQQSRLTPQDGMNLNRVFPGRASGSISEQIAHRCFSEALKCADALVDLHSGGDHLRCCFHGLFHNDGSPSGKVSEQMARSIGTHRLCNLPPELFVGSALRAFAAAGKPAVLVESGGGARVNEADIDDEVQAIVGACRALGILPARASASETAPIGIGSELNILISTRGGIFCACVEPGQEVSDGEELGQIVDLYGDVVERFACESQRAWVAAIRRPYMPVFAGDDIAELVPMN
jgi:predicted deacylase